MRTLLLGRILLLLGVLFVALRVSAAVPLPWYKQLNEWHFNDPYLLTVNTGAPQAAVGFTLAPSWNTNALRLSGGEMALVQYPIFEDSGRTNLICNFGTVRFWYRPLWTSTTLGGAGPGDYARLLETGLWTGNATYGWWGIYLNPEGTQISFGGQANGHSRHYVHATVAWTSNLWHQVVVSYSPSNSFIYLDGQLAAQGTGVTRFASAAVQEQTGLTIGSTSVGESLMQGDMDVLATFNYQLDDSVISNGFWNVNPPPGTSGGSSGSPSPPGSGGSCTNCTNVLSYSKSAYSDLTNSTNLWIEIRFGSNSISTLVLHNTHSGTNYQILSRTALITNSAWFVLEDIVGAENTNRTFTSIDTSLLPAQFLVFGVSEDSDDDGLSDVFELLVSKTSVTNADTGITGIPDGYKDPDGDGWTHLDELRNGTDPLRFNTPASPQNVVARFNGTNIVISWEAARGPVLGYRIIDRQFGTELGTVSSNVFSFTDSDIDWATGNPWFGQTDYEIRAFYAEGDSEAEIEDIWNPELTVNAVIIRGTNEQMFLCVSAWPEKVTAVVITRIDDTVTEIPKTNFQNGIYPLGSQPYLGNQRIQGTDASGARGTPGFVHLAIEGAGLGNNAFVDQRQTLLDNLRFLLRSATRTQRFSYASEIFGELVFQRFPNASMEYEYAGFHESYEFDPIGNGFYTAMDASRSVEENFLWRNFVFNQSLFDSSGVFLTGAHRYNYEFNTLRMATDPLFFYDGTNSSSQLATNQTASIYFDGFSIQQSVHLTNVGLTIETIPQRAISLSQTVNLFGLPIDFAQLKLGQNPVQFPVVAANQSVGIGNDIGDVFINVRQPVFGSNSYYFSTRDKNDSTFSPPIPNEPDFSPTNTTPLFFTSVGQPIYISGWAKKRILNGDTNKFGYLAQFFDKALKADATGNATTNQTGILSEYGEFFPTEPGLTILKTRSDIESAEVGQAFLNVLSVNVDANHDGVMNLTFSSEDSTSTQWPFVFWVNDDMDRGNDVDCNIIGQNCDWEEDDVLVDKHFPASDPRRHRPDHSFSSLTAGYQIPSQRDLEDYARLHLPGVSNLLANLPSGYVVELAMNNLGPDAPAIRLFKAVEPDGGNQYLFDQTNAARQIAVQFAPYLGVVSSTTSLNLTTLFQQGVSPEERPNDYYIVCGQSRGRGQLILRIRRDSEVVAEASAFIELKNVKEMYERWTVGDTPTERPMIIYTNASEELPKGQSGFRYTHNRGSDTNLPYVLYVHGWNMERWEKDRFAEAAFKRLYWQGYRGRFGLFRWPTYNRFDAYNWFGQNPATSPNHFDNSEFNAWRSGEGLRRLLVSLNNKYPGNVRVFAHSMGNIVTGQALRTNTTLVSVYAAMQAALPAGGYYTSAPPRSVWFENDATPELYRWYCGTTPAQPYFHAVSGAAAYINFYNPVDWALAWWEIDQNLKPTDTLGYSFMTNTFFRYRDAVNERILTCPADTFELFAYGVEGRCFALGQQASVGGVFDDDFEVLLDPTFAFGNLHKGHSGQFRSTNMKRAAFWSRLVDVLDIAQP